MSDYETEEQQVEAIKDWWKQNGGSVLLGVALGVGAIFSWSGWKSYVESKAMEASDMYAAISDAIDAGENEKVSTLAEELRVDHGKSSFAALASLMQAKISAESNELAEAADHLQWVVDNSTLEELRTVAAVRKARVLLADGKPAEALEILPDSATSGFASLAAEIRGDIYLSMGESDKAREAYLEAQVNGRNQINPTLLGMKLDDLAAEDQASEKVTEDDS